MNAPQGPETWTDERRRAVREAIRARRDRQVRGGRVFGFALLGLVAAGVLLRLPEAWWIPAVGAIALAGLVFRLVNWKCPACGEGLPTRGSARECPGCGAPLD